MVIVAMNSPFNSVEECIEAIRAGQMVVVADDENRENEGDLIIAASYATADVVNFMALHGRGLVCVALTGDRVQDLGLNPMPMRNRGDRFSTAFLDSVDAAPQHGVSTGISAADRAKTIQLLVDVKTTLTDLVSPGHVFPLEARKGGVLVRAGHTEAAVDLAKLAGLPPAGVICEILQPDGTMARLPQLQEFAKTHGLKLLSIADLIEYRRHRERLIELIEDINLPTDFGDFRLRLYRSIADGLDHLALIKGDLRVDDPPLVRVHSECLTGDVFGSMRCDCGPQLHAAMAAVSEAGRGVVLYMRQEGRGIGLANKLHAYALQEKGFDTVEANEKLGFPADLRDYGVGAQMLLDLGLRRIKLLTNNPRKIVGLSGYGLEIVERVQLAFPPSLHNRRYLDTKRSKMGHMF